MASRRMKATSTKVKQSDEEAPNAVTTVATSTATNSVSTTTTRVMEKEVSYPEWVNDWDDFLLTSWP